MKHRAWLQRLLQSASVRSRCHRAGASDRNSTFAMSLAAVVPVLRFVRAMKADHVIIDYGSEFQRHFLTVRWQRRRLPPNHGSSRAAWVRAQLGSKTTRGREIVMQAQDAGIRAVVRRYSSSRP